MNEVLVIGHRNPDTDAICSAIGYAEFKRRTGMPNVVAARCGDTNDRIDFVLKTFWMPPPRFVANVSPKVRDVMQTYVLSVSPDATIAEALNIMDEGNIRVLPVLDQDRRCTGLVSAFKTSRFFYPSSERLMDSRRVLATIRNLAATLGGDLLTARDTEREEDLILMIGAMSLRAFSQRLNRYPREKLVVVVGDRQDIQELAISERVRVLVLTGGLPVETATIETAKAHGVSLILSPHDSATTAMLCRAAIKVEHMIDEQFLAFREDQALTQVQSIAATSNLHSFPVLDQRQRTVGMLSKYDFLKKVDRKLILVDHNELSQAVEGADQVEILEIIDHHRIGNLTTHQPILFRNEPVGSTSTIVADCFFRHGVEMPESIAGLLLAGLVSDTLNLTSPTTTPRDAELLARLETIAGVSAREFTEKLFASGSVLVSKPARQAIVSDCKEYVEDGRSFSVAQIEELGYDAFWQRKPDVVEALESYRSDNNYFFSCLLVTDVVQQGSLLLVAGADVFVQQIDYPKIEPGIFELKGVVSRKKQLMPFLSHCLQKCR